MNGLSLRSMAKQTWMDDTWSSPVTWENIIKVVHSPAVGKKMKLR